MSNVTYIVTVPSERLLGLSGKTFNDAAGQPVSPEEATLKTFYDAAGRPVSPDEATLKPSDAAKKDSAEEEGSETNLDGEQDHDSSDSDENNGSFDGDEEDEEDEQEEEDEEDDNISYRDGPDEFEEFEWMKSMYGEATIPDDTSNNRTKRIANCVANLIYRHEIRGTFYADMEEPSQDTSALAFELFDRYGCLKREFLEHPVKKGSGVWGKELDTGNFLLIESVTVEKDHQRQGVATKLANTVWEKARKLDGFVPYAFVWATHLNTRSYRLEASYLSDIERNASFDRSQTRAVAFWRSLGYRRVGSTQWFCLAADPNHPSHRLAANEDWDPPVHEVPVEDGRELKEVYPVHYKIDHSSDDDALKFLRQRLLTYPATDPSWSKVDREGKSIVHYAAECSKPHTLRWMLEQTFGVELLSRRNHAGETPLEALETVLESDRVKRDFQMMIIPVSDQFTGFKPKSIACLLLRRGISDPSEMEHMRVAYGCTCGECIGGFMSPRMTFALLCQAEILHDELNQVVDGTTRSECCESNDHHLQHTTRRIRANLETNKSLRQGFTNLFNHAAPCLRSKQIPHPEMVLRAADAADEWPPCSKNFCQRGGTVASVVLTIIESAMQQDEFTGDGFHQEVFQEDIDKMKSCRNDNEWGFVRTLWGYAETAEATGVALGMGLSMGMSMGMGGPGVVGVGMGAPQVLGKRTRGAETEDGFNGTSKQVA